MPPDNQSALDRVELASTLSVEVQHQSNPPDLSFIIPAYNCPNYLEECINSIQRAALPSYEIIVIDDGSTVDIREVVDRFTPATCYVRQENQGPAAARNNGIRLSRGKYIQFLDADDLVVSRKTIKKQLAMLDSHTDVGLVYSQAIQVDSQGRPFGVRKPRFGHRTCVRTSQEELSCLLLGNYITTSSTIVRRTALAEVGLFDPEIYSGEDWDLWLRIARLFSVGYVAEPGVAYRVHGDSITARNSVESMLDVHLKIVDRAFEDPQTELEFRQVRHCVYAQMYRRAAGRAYRNGQMRAARYCAGQALWIDGEHRVRQYISYAWLIARSAIPAPAHSMLRRASHRFKVERASLRVP